MYKELYGDEAKEYLQLYTDEIIKCMADDKQTILVDEEYRGFFIVMDISEPMIVNKRYQGTRVYIRPGFRKTRLLKEFYDELFYRFDGDIFGQTEAGSEHIKVLDKRHDLIAKVYKLKRR